MGEQHERSRARAVADGTYALNIGEHHRRQATGELEDCADYRRALLQALNDCWDNPSTIAWTIGDGGPR